MAEAVLDQWVDERQAQGRYTFLRTEARDGSGLSVDSSRTARGVATTPPGVPGCDEPLGSATGRGTHADSLFRQLVPGPGVGHEREDADRIDAYLHAGGHGVGSANITA
jgi:hypothetical protein